MTFRDPQKKLIALALGISLFFMGRWLIQRVVIQNNPTDKNLVDLHAHVGCLDGPFSDCFISKSMKSSFKYQVYLRALGTTERELREKGASVLFKNLSDGIKASRRIKKAVVLALDGAVKDGVLDRTRTELYVPNEYVAQEILKFDNLLFGASINPYRKDALKRLEWAREHGAVLVKWIPSIMFIDPADPKIIPFYKKLLELNLPLLVHTGDERTFTQAADEFCDPKRLELPLSLGVRVIAAHLASTGDREGKSNYERLTALKKRYPNLYADISALTQYNRLGVLAHAIKSQEWNGRLLYGSDWPLQFFPLVSPLWHVVHGDLSLWQAFWIELSSENTWDRDVLLKEYLGADAQMLEDSSRFLNNKN